jgi:oligoendopeptidase F
VPADLDAGDLAAVEDLAQALAQRALATRADLERWLADESELQARIGAELARRYIAMTCHTDDAAKRQRYLDFERDVLPRVKVLGDALNRAFLDSPALPELSRERYGVLLRQRQTAREIFRAENTVLEAREAELQTRQQELMGSITVQFEGREHTLQQMAPYYEKQDRGLRERAFRASLQARRPHWEELEAIFDELVELRTAMGRNAGFDTYTPLRFKQLQRFDYGPQQCLQLHAAIEHAVVPAVMRLDEKRRRRLSLDSLRPWDLEVDADGRAPLRPFTTELELIELSGKVFAAVDARFRDEFEILRTSGLLDLMSRKGKAPGGYQYTLEDVRLPFIFANSVGTHRDVQTLLHEGGHAFHAILSRDQELLAWRDSPIEFAETASMSMELMGLEELAGAYGDDAARHARDHHLEGLLRIFPWIASIDALQHQVYANPGHSREQRKAQWLEIRARFAPGLDWSGFEDALAHQWTGQGHLFGHPFYYIEYGIAQIAALQIWQRYRQDPRTAVEAYRNALALGGSRPLPELFAAAGVAFDLSQARLADLVADVERALAE